MLDSLHIQNYRLFKDLKIEKLGQVNLISGKNNCGKTALLEALRILASDCNNSVVNNIIFNRGDFKVNRPFDTYWTLFNKNSDKYFIVINQWQIERADGYSDAKIQAFEYPNELDKLGNSIVGRRTEPFSLLISPNNPDDKAVFVPFSIESENNPELWESISLTSKEEDVINILKIVEPKILKIRIDNKKAKVVMANEDTPIPLKNLGDGVNRLLTIALALVSAKNKILLIDEFEVGLHHGIQEQLWEIIFKYAKKWDIQVFVTTHSLDTVHSFSEVSDKYEGMGEFMRLQKSRMTDEIEAVVYSKKSLDYAIEDSLEMR